MSRIHLDQDIQPLSEFRAGVASFIKQINETRRPLVITQRGKGVAVVLDVAEYEAMQEKIELLEEMRTAEAQLAAGLGISNEDARSQVLGASSNESSLVTSSVTKLGDAAEFIALDNPSAAEKW